MKTYKKIIIEYLFILLLLVITGVVFIFCVDRNEDTNEENKEVTVKSRVITTITNLIINWSYMNWIY